MPDPIELDISGTSTTIRSGRHYRLRLTNPNYGEALAAEFAAKVSGLYYISESDSEFRPFSIPYSGPVSTTGLAAKLSLGPEIAVETRDPSGFWCYYTNAGIHGDEDVPRFAALKQLMEERLTDIHMFHTGDPYQAEFVLYLVGLDGDGNLVGLEFDSVET